MVFNGLLGVSKLPTIATPHTCAVTLPISIQNRGAVNHPYYDIINIIILYTNTPGGITALYGVSEGGLN